MSLLKRNKDKQLAAEKKLAARHAIVKMSVDRNVRDAYFQGLVFAAVANDDQIEESERTRLRELGEALELTAEDVAEAIQCLAGMDDDAKMGVIEECARQLTNAEVAEYFLKEFSELWFLGGGNKDEFEEFRSQLIDWMGDDVRMSEEKKVKAAEEAEAKRKAEEAAAIEAKRKTEEAEMRERELERQRKIDAERKAEEERRIAEAARVREELRRVKEEARKKADYKTFGADIVRVVKELSLFEKERVTSSELNLLREGLLDEGFGIVCCMKENLGDDDLKKIINYEVEVSRERFEERSRFLRPCQIEKETTSFRQRLNREVRWMTIAWLVLNKGVSNECLNEVNDSFSIKMAPLPSQEICIAHGLFGGLFG